jgi:hypothetical protein
MYCFTTVTPACYKELEEKMANLYLDGHVTDGYDGAPHEAET